MKNKLFIWGVLLVSVSLFVLPNIARADSDPFFGSVGSTSTDNASTKIGWTTTGAVTSYEVTYGLGANYTGYSANALCPGTIATTTGCISVTSLSPGTTYSYVVHVKDATAHPTDHYSDSRQFTTTGSGQTGTGPTTDNSPTTPNLTTSAISSSRIDLSWTVSTDTDGTGLAGYKIFRKLQTESNYPSEPLTTRSSSELSYSDTNVNPSTGYSYRIFAYDTASTPNYSSYSDSSASTPAGANTTNQTPSTPTGLRTGNISLSSIQLIWDSVTGTDTTYVVYRGGSKIADSITGTNYTDSGLSASTSYSYQVAAHNSSGTSSLSGSVFATTSAAPTATSTVTKTIRGRVLFADGSTVTDAEVDVYNSSAQIVYHANVSGDGTYSVQAAVGSWNVNVRPIYTTTKWVSSSALSQSVSFSDNGQSETKEINFSIAISAAAQTGPNTQPTAQPNTQPSANPTAPKTAAGPILLQGKVIYPDGTPASDALIYVWSADFNSAAKTKTYADGSFSFQILGNSTWHLNAGKTNNNTGYRSNEITEVVTDKTVSGIELDLQKISEPLPPPQNIQRPVVQEASVALNNGAKVVVPGGAAASSGNITLNVQPTAEAPTTSNAQVVGLAYDVTVADQAGSEIHALSKNIDITFPYDDATLLSLSLTPEQIVPSYFNDTTNAWIKLANFTLDKVNKVVVAHVDHLTRFALIGAADVTPPEAPTSVTAVRVGGGVLLTWVNPKTDFRHAKIYRSTAAGTVGTVVIAQVANNSATDATAAAGVNYYYVVRAVDPAGNESANTAQVSSSSGSIVIDCIDQKTMQFIACKATFSRNLSLGSSGADVKLLQQILIKDGEYPEGLVTGFFGKLTQAAAIKFQEKYKSEVLAPANLAKGSGFIGSLSRRKLLLLKAQYSL